MNKFRSDYFERMLITIKFRIFHLPVCCLKTLRLSYTILLICLLFCMGMKIDVGTSRVFENRVLRRLQGLKGEEVTAGLEKLHNDNFCNLFSFTYIVKMIKSRRMGLVEHVICMGVQRNAYNILVGKPERDHMKERVENGG